jgi:hypothetical protein
MYKLAAMILLALSMSHPVFADDIWPEEVFPEGQTRSLNKGQYWSINCMDFSLKTKEIKIGKEVIQRIPIEMFLAVMCK